jgi:DNA-directed RNA polymerase subunit E'/Rpb7|tara:strand:+ start:2383 stop:2523 length:141 start_codon:yes stop_codon:yes gene_type:complete
MFFHITQEKNVILEPRHFGKNLQEVLREKLKNEVRVDQGQTHAFPG